jgi:hypothetical protein
MSNATEDWKALPHAPIEKLSENLWRVSGSLPRMTLRRTMTIARRGDGRLVIHSAIALDETAMKAIEALGTPAYLIVPNGFHRKDAPAFKRRYPELTVLAPRGARDKIVKVIPVDGAMLVRSADGMTIVLGDLVFNMDRKKDPLGFFFTTLLGSAPGPRISRLVKALMVKDRAALRSDLARLAATPGLVRLIVAHEKVAHGADASAALISASKFL